MLPAEKSTTAIEVPCHEQTQNEGQRVPGTFKNKRASHEVPFLSQPKGKEPFRTPKLLLRRVVHGSFHGFCLLVWRKHSPPNTKYQHAFGCMIEVNDFFISFDKIASRSRQSEDGLTPEYCGKRPPEQWELWEGKPLKPYHLNRTLGAQKASSNYCQTSTAKQRELWEQNGLTVPLQPYFGFHWEKDQTSSHRQLAIL